MIREVFDKLYSDYLDSLPPRPDPHPAYDPLRYMPISIPREVSDVSRQCELARDNANQEEVRSLQNAERSVGVDVLRTEAELELARDQLQQVSHSPRHLSLGYWIMVGLAVIGVCIPLGLMVDDWGDWRGTTAFGLFIFALLALAWYMAILIFPTRMERSSLSTPNKTTLTKEPNNSAGVVHHQPEA